MFKLSEEHLPHTEANYGTVVFLGLKETLQKMLTFYLLPVIVFEITRLKMNLGIKIRTVSYSAKTGQFKNVQDFILRPTRS